MADTNHYNPDVLSCLANLSSDEVFTPPQIANQMLNLLPPNLWSSEKSKFLDPGCKSGVFLREIARRLDEGLQTKIPDRRTRLNHIFENQIYGIATTELTALMSRRSVYCSKQATSKYSVCDVFKDQDGNIHFKRIEHTWKDGRCIFCGAGEKDYERGAELETHAYEFIHTASLEQVFDMKFDVIIGNPPYQLSDGGHSASASPIYQKFVETAINLKPRFVVMITPSRWFTGGKGLDEFRTRMLQERRLRNLVDYPKLYDGFPGVKIRGGVSYFLWDRDYDGPCAVQTMWDGEPLGKPVKRYLDAYDVLVRRNEAVSILDKVLNYRVSGKPEKKLNDRVSGSKPFGFRTNFHGKKSASGLHDAIKLHGSQRISWIDRSDIEVNAKWIDEWKVLMTAVQGTSAAVETKFLSNPIIAGPGEACTETYLVAGHFEDEQTASRYADYLRTRFVRFLVSLRKAAQHATRSVYGFVPDVPLGREWDDQKLYKRYGLTDQEIAFIESTVKPIDNADDSSDEELSDE
jgi:site-specific DNA-methyltransferase (adenine-specific)